MLRQTSLTFSNGVLRSSSSAMGALSSVSSTSLQHRFYKTHNKRQRRTRKQGKTYARSELSPTRRLKFPAYRETLQEPDKTSKIEDTTRRHLEVVRTEVDPQYLSNATADEFLNYNHSWANFYHRISQSVPRTLLSSPVYPKLPDSWFSRTFPGYELGKPTEFFETQFNSKDNRRNWKSGYKSLNAQGKFFDKYTPKFQQFNTRDRPLNPFRYKPHLVNRISFKNPRMIFPFLTETGKIKGRVYTGLKGRAQRKVGREAKKMRMLGLTGYGHNPEYGKDHSQPHTSFLDYKSFMEMQDALDNHAKRKKSRELRLKERKIVWERDFDTKRQLKREYLGLTDEQIEYKKTQIKHLVMENEYLKTLGRSTPIQRLSKVGKTQIDDLLVNPADSVTPDNNPEKQKKSAAASE